MPTAKEYVDARGISPFHKWFIDLHAPEAAKVTGAIIRMEQGNFGNVKGVGSGVFEYVLDFGPVIAFTSAKTATRSSFRLGVERKAAAERHQPGNCEMAGFQTAEENREIVMALTREFKLTVRARVQRDAAFRKELLRESVENFLAGDVDTGKTILRDYINATIGFEKLAKVTHHSPKSLMRMLGPSGNPHARNLFEILSALQEKAKVQFTLKTFGAAVGA